MNVIHVPADQIAAVDGPSLANPSEVLTCARLTDGSGVLGLQNIDNPAFADRAALLRSFPVVDYDAVIVPLLPQQVTS